MTEIHKENYCLDCDANNGDYNDAYKYSNMNQLRDSAIGYGNEKNKYSSILIVLFNLRKKTENALK